MAPHPSAILLGMRLGSARERKRDMGNNDIRMLVGPAAVFMLMAVGLFFVFPSLLEIHNRP